MTTYVLIPGACHGGWCFDDLAAALRAEGHRVLTPTLTGVAEHAHLAHAGVNLETHIADVIAEMQAQHVTDAVLAGHSYGGMVITAVADRIPLQVDSLVYLDAFVPRDGDSVWTLTDDGQHTWYAGVDATGYGVPPLPFFDDRATAHPLASLMQPIRLRDDLSRFRLDYVYATKWEGESPFTATFERVRTDPAWRTRARRGTQPHARQPQ